MRKEKIFSFNYHNSLFTDTGVAFISESVGYAAGDANGVGPAIFKSTDGENHEITHPNHVTHFSPSPLLSLLLSLLPSPPPSLPLFFSGSLSVSISGSVSSLSCTLFLSSSSIFYMWMFVLGLIYFSFKQLITGGQHFQQCNASFGPELLLFDVEAAGNVR